MRKVAAIASALIGTLAARDARAASTAETLRRLTVDLSPVATRMIQTHRMCKARRDALGPSVPNLASAFEDDPFQASTSLLQCCTEFEPLAATYVLVDAMQDVTGLGSSDLKAVPGLDAVERQAGYLARKVVDKAKELGNSDVEATRAPVMAEALLQAETAWGVVDGVCERAREEAGVP